VAAARAGFFAAVYALVRRIPRGRVLSYGQVAALLGVPRGARAVGWALRALKPGDGPVPWQRVVGSGGRISPRDGAGMARQQEKLRAEGVRFQGGRVDLARHAWTPPQLSGAGSPRRSRAARAKARRRPASRASSATRPR
jgi:methylated-DNA-protein-cysteine methyltransferase related protein